MASSQRETPFDETEVVEETTQTGFEHVGELNFESINGYTLRATIKKPVRRALGIPDDTEPANDCYINRSEGIFVIRFNGAETANPPSDASDD